MKPFTTLGVLACLFFVITVGPASAQVIGPICLGAGLPLSTTLVLTFQVVAGTQFLVVGHIFGEEPISGSGFLTGNVVRFAVVSGPRGGMPIAPALSLMGILPLDSPGSGTVYCAGGAQCPAPTGATLTVAPSCG